MSQKKVEEALCDLIADELVGCEADDVIAGFLAVAVTTAQAVYDISMAEARVKVAALLRETAS